jgi:hypothetical protein
MSIPSVEFIMPRALPASPSRADWRSLYRAAILETDTKLVSKKVLEAEKAVLARGRELFYSSGGHEEQECLEDALYALRAFRSAWEHRAAETTSTMSKQ